MSESVSLGFSRRGVRSSLFMSIVIHIVVFVGIPFLMKMTKQTARFERPPTFELVSIPSDMRPVQPVVKPKKQIRRPVARRRVPREASRPVPRESAPVVEEDVEELASLLEELPRPVSVSSRGVSKYDLYLARVQQKVERFWTPPREDKSDSVVISFTIFNDGTISDPVILKRSRTGSLDEYALRAVKLAAPFGRLPPGVPNEPILTLRPTKQ